MFSRKTVLLGPNDDTGSISLYFGPALVSEKATVLVSHIFYVNKCENKTPLSLTSLNLTEISVSFAFYSVTIPIMKSKSFVVVSVWCCMHFSPSQIALAVFMGQ